MYRGSLAKLQRTEMGAVRPGSRVRFRFIVSLHDWGIPPGPLDGDNARQGSRAAVGFRWLAHC